MADYIDRKELLKYAVGLEENEKVVFEDVIEDMPSIDAVEQKHGHWIVKRRGGYSDTQCSKCGGYDRDIGIAKYCRNCGAKMDEEIPPDTNQLTNRDWLNSLSNEQFRDFFLSYLKVKVNVFLDGGDISELITRTSYQQIIRSDIQSDIGFLEWLKAPCAHTEIVEDDPYN